MAKRESVPPEHWPALIAIARNKRVSGVTLATLTKLRPARKPYTRQAGTKKRRAV